MIEFLIDRKRRIGLVRYSVELSAENLRKLDDMSADFAAREGSMDGIIDFRGVPSMNMRPPWWSIAAGRLDACRPTAAPSSWITSCRSA